jgi:hypothetical protein
MLTIILLGILLGCIGFLYAEGTWSNAIRLMNVLVAALLATAYFEPLADWLDGWQPTYTYCWDFLALWIIFCVAVVVLRAATDWISRVNVRFLNIADQVGSVVFAALVGWVMMAFTLTTLHTAPLGKTFFFGGFSSHEAMFLGMSPDAQWLGFVEHMSSGPLCRSASEQEWQQKKFVFCRQTTNFVDNYLARRKGVDDHAKRTGSVRVNPDDKNDKAVIPQRAPETPAAAPEATAPAGPAAPQ